MPAEDGIETAKGVLTARDEEFNVEEGTEERTMDAGCTEVTHNETAKGSGGPSGDGTPRRPSANETLAYPFRDSQSSMDSTTIIILNRAALSLT